MVFGQGDSAKYSRIQPRVLGQVLLYSAKGTRLSIVGVAKVTRPNFLVVGQSALGQSSLGRSILGVGQSSLGHAIPFGHGDSAKVIRFDQSSLGRSILGVGQSSLGRSSLGRSILESAKFTRPSQSDSAKVIQGKPIRIRPYHSYSAMTSRTRPRVLGQVFSYSAKGTRPSVMVFGQGDSAKYSRIQPRVLGQVLLYSAFLESAKVHSATPSRSVMVIRPK